MSVAYNTLQWIEEQLQTEYQAKLKIEGSIAALEAVKAKIDHFYDVEATEALANYDELNDGDAETILASECDPDFLASEVQAAGAECEGDQSTGAQRVTAEVEADTAGDPRDILY